MLFRWDDARDWRAAYLYKVILLSVAMINTHYIRYFASFG
ncbi:putative membrane protein [Vibrio parahaemolyticus VP2007-007]|nr:putative membrane protein [Vibrio parahaemolyticus VP2007-007]